MSSDATSEPYASADGYRQRAALLADLGRYDEAASELGDGLALTPGEPGLLTLLARVQLAAARPAEALAATDPLVGAEPATEPPVPALVLRGLALTDLRRFGEAAAVADRILALGPADGYAQRSAAAILAGARNGQPALNAAWRGVELTPEEPQAHLVLGLVAARLELFDLAERAYAEALRLDPALTEARHDVGVVRLEQRRYAEALEQLAELAGSGPAPVPARRSVGEALRRLVLYGAGYTLVAVVLIALLAAENAAMSRLWAVLVALGGVVVVWGFAARVPNLTRAVLPELLRTDRALALSLCAVAAAPCLILLYALVGGPWPLALAIGATSLAEFAALRRVVRPAR
ncbi:tetratricopeptide repeat protein [Micromonospora sp. NPDC049559]|uniref:tetratricopeptide repeat protein n=1 Tax=Micromonospora sp. NPDC049559 TaxID=3155923 RepID=UPI003412D50F